MFAKVFSQIFDSSIAEDWQVRHVFEDLMKLADMKGVVDMTVEAIARRTNMPLDIVARAISELEKPDPRSRTRDYEGRRIIPIDPERGWGWLLVNYEYYRSLASEEQRREKTRNRVARFRETNEPRQKLLTGNADVTPVTLSNDCNAMQRQRQRQMENTPLPPEGESAERVRRLGKCFRRIDPMRWSEKEFKAYREIAELCPIEEFELVEAYYLSRHPYLRKDLITLLNNWNGEADRARRWDENGRRQEQRVGGAPLHEQLKSLESVIRRHPANPDNPKFSQSSVTDEQRKAFKDLLTKRHKLNEQIAGGA